MHNEHFSLLCHINGNFISGIHSPDWTRAGVGHQKKCLFCTAEQRTNGTDKTLNDACLNGKLFNTFFEKKFGKNINTSTFE